MSHLSLSKLTSSMYRGICSCCVTVNNHRVTSRLKSNVDQLCYPSGFAIRSLTTTPKNDRNEKVKVDDTKADPSIGGKLKVLWKKYGILAVGTYTGVYVGTLGSVFVALDFDIFNAATFGMDPNYAVQKVIFLFVC